MHRLTRTRRNDTRDTSIQRVLDDARAYDADVRHARSVALFCHLRECIDHLYLRDMIASTYTMRLRDI